MVVGLALTAALCFGAQTLLVERGLSRTARSDSGSNPGAALAAAAVSLAGSTAVLWALVGLQRGVSPASVLSLRPVALLPFVVAGVADPALTRLCYFEGIDRVGPSVASAVTAGSPAVAALIAVLALGASLSVPEALGVACVVAGVAWLQLGAGGGADGGDGCDVPTDDLIGRELADARPRDAALPVAAAVFIGTASVVVEAGLRGFSDALVATAVTQSAALAALLPVAVQSANARRLAARAPQSALFAFVAAGLVVGVGWYAMFLALGRGSVVTVLPLVSTYPLVVVAASYAAARERPRSPALLLAVALVVAGAAAVQAA